MMYHTNTETTMPAHPELILCSSTKVITNERLCSLIKSNISCHAGKPLSQELIDILCTQIVESIDYFLNNGDQNL